jgi:hypothetical protein
MIRTLPSLPFVIAAALVGITMMGLMALPAFSDCTTNYSQSLELLNTHINKTKDKASNSNDPDAFETSFRESVQKLQNEKCLPELMSLIQHIQGEQQKYPHPNPKAKPAPITD